MDKKTIITIVVGAVIVLIIGTVTGLLVGYKNSSTLELEAWPSTDSTGNQELINYRVNDPGSLQHWTQKLDVFFKEYKKGYGDAVVKGAENRVSCSPRYPPQGKQVCDVEIYDLTPCTPSNKYNYGNAGPCVFLRLNKVLDWIPEPYNSSENMPSHMPIDLKQHIKMVTGKPEANQVWVSCKGEEPTDEEFMGPIQYIPRRGFPTYYYPFTDKDGYLSPIVAVLFEKPKTGVLINIECRAWAKNILYDENKRHGSVHFELMVDRN